MNRPLLAGLAFLSIAAAADKQPEVHGSLDKEVIRAVIHSHLSDVKSCYDKALAAKPDLAGRLTVQFVVNKEGGVSAAVKQEATFDNALAEGCILDAVKRWKFPAPDGGGIVVVTYPFILKTENAKP